MAAAGPSHCNCRSLLIYLIYGSRVDYGGAYKSSSICERLRRRLQKEMRRGHRSVSLFSFSPVCLTATSLSSPPPRKQLASCFPSVTGPSPNCWAHLLLLFRFPGKSTAALSEMKVTAWRNPPQRARRRRRCVWVAGVINKSRYLSRGLAGCTAGQILVGAGGGRHSASFLPILRNQGMLSYAPKPVSQPHGRP